MGGQDPPPLSTALTTRVAMATTRVVIPTTRVVITNARVVMTTIHIVMTTARIIMTSRLPVLRPAMVFINILAFKLHSYTCTLNMHPD